MDKNEIITNKDARIIYLTGSIEEEKTNLLIKKMDKMEKIEPRDPITIKVNSYGGEYDSFIAIYDSIKGSECDIHTIGVGKCMSGGAFIVMSGDQRSATKNTRFMLHSLQVSLPKRSIQDNKIRHKEQERIQDKLKTIVQNETGRNVSKVEEDLNREKYLSAHDALKYGLIDEVINHAVR